jgi:predicted PurR-regulated permease PerM
MNRAGVGAVLEASTQTARPRPSLRSRDRRLRRIFVLMLAGAFIALFLLLILPYFEALVLAAVFAGLLYPLHRRIARRIGRESIAALATTALALLVVVLPLTGLIGVLAREAVHVSEVVAPLVDGKNEIRDISSVVPRWVPYRGQILERANDVIKQTGTFVVDRVTQATQSTVIFLLDVFVMLYAMFYFLVDGRRLVALLNDYTPLGDEDKHEILTKGVAVTRATLKSLLVIGALQGVLGGVAFAAVGIESPVFWGLVLAVASVLPLVGTALVWVPATIALFLRGDTLQALALLAWCVFVVVGVLDYVLRPRLIGNDVRMPDLVVLLSTLGGVAMFGVAGLIIGPVIAGLFITSLGILTTTFDRDLRSAAESSAIVSLDGTRSRVEPTEAPRAK